MTSHDLIRRAVKRPGVKQVADYMKLSSALIYKWTDSADTNGSLNPLDRVLDLYLVTGRDERIISWLCAAAGGTFVKNPAEPRKPKRAVAWAVELVAQVGRFFTLFNAAVGDDGRDRPVSRPAADAIREQWEKFKAAGEAAVRQAESMVRRE